MSSTGQIVGGLVGAVAGYFLSGMNPMGAVYGASLGMTLGGIADPPELPTQVGPRLSDNTWQSSTLGAILPRGYGTYPVVGNIFWMKGNKIDEVVTTSGGGKGSGRKAKSKTYAYYVTLAVGLCDCRHTGPIAGIGRIWLTEKLWYDGFATDADTIAASNQAAENFTLYTGDEDQQPDPTIQADLGVANTPAWRGRAYLVLRDIPLREVGNTPAGLQIKVEVILSGESVAYDYTIHSAPVRLWVDIAWNESAQLFCAVAFSTDKYGTSPDGQTWTERTLPATVTPGAITPSIASNGKIFVAILDYGPTGVYTSPTGLDGSWTQRSFDPRDDFGAEGYEFIVWTGSRFLAAGAQTPFQASETGYAWRAEIGPEGVGINGPATLTWNGDVVVCGMATGDNSIYSSPTGLTGSWTHRFTPTGAAYNRSATIGRSVLIPSGSSTTVLRSPDGKTWSEDSAPTLEPFWDVISDGRSYLGVVNAGYLVSSDGLEWTFTDTSADGNSAWYCLGIHGGIIVSLPADAGGQALRIAPSLTGSGAPLSEIVESECLLSGLLESSDLITTSLTDTVHGYRIGTLTSLRSVLEPLQMAYPFDVRQTGYKIEFLRRPQSSVASIPAADLGAHPAGQEVGVLWTESTEVDSQLARTLRVQYLDSAREYNLATQSAERLNTTATNEITIDLALVLSAREAAGLAETLLYTQWLERHTVSFSIPAALYAALEPSDVVTVTTASGSYSVRLTAIHYTSNGLLECSGKFNSALHYTPVAQGASSLVGGPTIIYPLGPTWYVLLDLPRVHAAQDQSGLLVVAYGTNSAWPGGVLMTTVDGGVTYQSIADLDPPGGTVGVAMNSIGAVESRLVDSASALQVALTSGDLESVSHSLLLAGANHFAYGTDGRWEIIGARTVTLEADGSYTLQDLLRGRYGTEWAMGLHTAGDAVVLLSPNDLSFLGLELGAIGQQRSYRAITYERSIDTDSDFQQTYRGVNLQPLAPVYLTGDRNPSTGDWSLSCLRRARSGGEWRDYVDIPADPTETYEFDVYADSSYSSVLRTLSASVPTVAYSSAQQGTDFGSDQLTLYLRIYALSSIVGRGPALTTSITRI